MQRYHREIFGMHSCVCVCVGVLFFPPCEGREVVFCCACMCCFCKCVGRVDDSLLRCSRIACPQLLSGPCVGGRFSELTTVTQDFFERRLRLSLMQRNVCQKVVF